MAIGVGGIGGISSMNAISQISYVTQKPQSYALDNETQVSASYVQAMEQVSGESGIQGVQATRPVQYANATNTSDSLEVTRQVSQKYNEIASAFEGISTSYSADMRQQMYAMVGSSIDMYA